MITSDQDIIFIQEALSRHQRNLHMLKLQAADYTASTLPLHLAHAINEQQAIVDNYKEQLLHHPTASKLGQTHDPWHKPLTALYFRLGIGVGLLLLGGVLYLMLYMPTPPPRPTAENTIRTYFTLLNQGQRDTHSSAEAWQMLTERFKNAQTQRGGYQGYKEFWRDIATPLDIIEVVIEEQPNNARGHVKLRHLNYPSTDQIHDYYVELIWDATQAQWRLDFSCEAPYEIGCPR